MRTAVWLLAMGWLAPVAQTQVIDGQASRSELEAPTRLEADGKPIEFGNPSGLTHAGPAVADVDGDGDLDLVVADMGGQFWFFENHGTDRKPIYLGKRKLQAGGGDAQAPVG